MITICKTVLSGAAPARIREQTEGLESGWLRDLAVKLAGDSALTVSVITHEDSTQELEVLRTGPPHQPLPPLGPPVTAGPDVPQRVAQAGQHG